MKTLGVRCVAWSLGWTAASPATAPVLVLSCPAQTNYFNYSDKVCPAVDLDAMKFLMIVLFIIFVNELIDTGYFGPLNYYPSLTMAMVEDDPIPDPDPVPDPGPVPEPEPINTTMTTSTEKPTTPTTTAPPAPPGGG